MLYKQEAIERYNKAVKKDSFKARQIIKGLKYQKDPYLLRCIAITYRDEAIFTPDSNEMRKKPDRRKLLLAKKYIDLAFSLNPDCIDVLYSLGSIYTYSNDWDIAHDCFIRVVEAEETTNIHVNCAEGDLPHVQMMKNDAFFELYRLWAITDNNDMTQRFLTRFKEGLADGIQTIYKPLEKFL